MAGSTSPRTEEITQQDLNRCKRCSLLSMEVMVALCVLKALSDTMKLSPVRDGAPVTMRNDQFDTLYSALVPQLWKNQTDRNDKDSSDNSAAMHVDGIKTEKKSPILVMGMPKAGTSSISEFFRCGNLTVSHWSCPTPTKRFQNDSIPGGHLECCGEMIKDNIDRGRPPLENTGDYDVYAQMDVAFPYARPICYFPQLQAFEQLDQHYPHAPMVLNVRDVNDWISSLRRWKKNKKAVSLADRFVQCDLPLLPKGKGKTDEELRTFYLQTIQHVTDAVARTGNRHKLVEVDIESPLAGNVLEQAFGIDKACWGKHNGNSKANGIGTNQG